mgnify:CR=1 FL=1
MGSLADPAARSIEKMPLTRHLVEEDHVMCPGAGPWDP